MNKRQVFLKRWIGDVTVKLLLPLSGIVWRRIWRSPDKVIETIKSYFGVDGLVHSLKFLPDNVLKDVLCAAGAKIEKNVIIHNPLIIVNYDDGLSKLKIDEGVHIGSGVLFDLAESIHVQAKATISMRCQLLTHQDFGNARPKGKKVKRKTAPLIIGEEAFIGAGATILCGASIGKRSLVAAGAVVTRPMPDDEKVGGIPAVVFNHK